MTRKTYLGLDPELFGNLLSDLLGILRASVEERTRNASIAVCDVEEEMYLPIDDGDVGASLSDTPAQLVTNA